MRGSLRATSTPVSEAPSGAVKNGGESKRLSPVVRSVDRGRAGARVGGRPGHRQHVGRVGGIGEVVAGAQPGERASRAAPAARAVARHREPDVGRQAEQAIVGRRPEAVESPHRGLTLLAGPLPARAPILGDHQAEVRREHDLERAIGRQQQRLGFGKGAVGPRRIGSEREARRHRYGQRDAGRAHGAIGASPRAAADARRAALRSPTASVATRSPPAPPALPRPQPHPPPCGPPTMPSTPAAPVTPAVPPPPPLAADAAHAAAAPDAAGEAAAHRRSGGAGRAGRDREHHLFRRVRRCSPRCRTGSSPCCRRRASPRPPIRAARRSPPRATRRSG